MIKLIFATLCIYVTGCAGSALEDTNEGDLNQEENDDSVSDIFHSSFWTSKEIKAIVGGCACFWGGIFTIFFMYLSVVFFRKQINKEKDVLDG